MNGTMSRIILVLAILVVLASAGKKGRKKIVGCKKYGHSCYGGHGRRSENSTVICPCLEYEEVEELRSFGSGSMLGSHDFRRYLMNGPYQQIGPPNAGVKDHFRHRSLRNNFMDYM